MARLQIEIDLSNGGNMVVGPNWTENHFEQIGEKELASRLNSLEDPHLLFLGATRAGEAVHLGLTISEFTELFNAVQEVADFYRQRGVNI